MIRQTGGFAVGEISTRSSPFLFGNRERLRRRHDAELRAGVVDHAEFPDPNPFVDARPVVAAWTSVECDKASYVVTVALALVGDLLRAPLR
jgi:hypothetical protein